MNVCGMNTSLDASVVVGRGMSMLLDDLGDWAELGRSYAEAGGSLIGGLPSF